MDKTITEAFWIQKLIEKRESLGLTKTALSLLMGKWKSYVIKMETPHIKFKSRIAKIQIALKFLDDYKPQKETDNCADDILENAFRLLSGSEPSIQILKKTLIPLGALIDGSTGREICSTLLCKAIFEEHYNAAKLLLEMGADPNKKNLLGQTPEEVAQKWCSWKSAIKIKGLLREIKRKAA